MVVTETFGLANGTHDIMVGIFEGLRIIVVEDRFLIAKDLAAFLEAEGATVIGPVASAQAGMRALEDQPVDLGILDIHLGTSTVDPIAGKLREQSIPFIYASGDGVGNKSDGDGEVPILLKPFGKRALVVALTSIFEPRPPSRGLI